MRGQLPERLLGSMDPREVSSIAQNRPVAITELDNSFQHWQDHRGWVERTASMENWSR
jgi:hypothetical protein